MIFGYARVSTKDQNLARQLDQLKKEGCEKIFEEKISGANMKREQLQLLLEQLKEGDEIVVTDLTRITRSTQDLFTLIEIIKEKGASIRSLKDTWLNTSSDSAYNAFLLTIMAGVNQLERDLTRERQREGIEIAKKAGRFRGRLRKYTSKHEGMNHAIKLYQEGNHTVKQITEITGVSRSALYRKIKEKQKA